MNIDDFGIFFLQNFEIYHFSKKISKFHFSKFQNVDFFSKIKISKIPNLPQITLRPSQTLLYSLKQPIGINPKIFRLRRYCYQGSLPLFRRFLALWLVYGAPPAWGMLFERFRKNPDARIFRFSDFQFSDFQIWNPSKIQ